VYGLFICLFSNVSTIEYTYQRNVLLKFARSLDGDQNILGPDNMLVVKINSHQNPLSSATYHFGTIQQPENNIPV
jgi:hypothetical protein